MPARPTMDKGVLEIVLLLGRADICTAHAVLESKGAAPPLPHLPVDDRRASCSNKEPKQYIFARQITAYDVEN